jgi:hypothetical protein
VVYHLSSLVGTRGCLAIGVVLFGCSDSTRLSVKALSRLDGETLTV